MTEEMRIDLLLKDIEVLNNPPESYDELKTKLPDIAHRMNKFRMFVIERDAGPNLELRSANNDLKIENERLKIDAADAREEANTANKVANDLVDEVAELKTRVPDVSEAVNG